MVISDSNIGESPCKIRDCLSHLSEVLLKIKDAEFLEDMVARLV